MRGSISRNNWRLIRMLLSINRVVYKKSLFHPNRLLSIESTNNNAQLKVESTSKMFGSPSYMLNGAPSASQMILKQGDNTLEVVNYLFVNYGLGAPSFVFEKNGDNGIITIKQCYATLS